MNDHQSLHKKLLPKYILMVIISVLGTYGLFKIAGTYALPFFWAIIIIQSLVSLVSILILDPSLIAERLKPQGKDHDPWCAPLLVVLYTIHLVIAFLDVGRLHLSDSVPVLIQILSVPAVAAGWCVFIWSMKTNLFFSSAIRLQPDREQKLVDSGPYRWMRHPGYISASVSLICEGLAFGSWLSVLAAILMVLVLIRRTYIEESLLQEGLPGYKEYAERVPYKWLPGIW
jgi:protein-S-isoprenylcysteine O-methyltransferase Ste14